MNLLLGIWVVLVPAVGSVNFPDIADRSFIDLCVREHNRARSEVSPPAADMLFMSWDHALAVTARAWAKRCIFEHNPLRKQDPGAVHPSFTSVGENLWVGAPPSHFSTTKAVKSWVDEKQNYFYNSNTCRKDQMCGHYTQVVWARSYKVGCAVHLCPEGIQGFHSSAGANFVCNYSPAGNIVGMRPYQRDGAPCSKCEGTCVDKLCRSKDRDTEINYDWRPAWDPDATEDAYGSEYISVIIIRPVALLCSAMAAFVVKYFYPDVFCYE